MKRNLVLFMLIGFCLLGCQEAPQQQLPIAASVPERPAGQTDVLNLACEPVPEVRVAFIGLGMRGPGAVRRMTYIPGVKIVALCDVEESRTKAANEILMERGLPKAREFYGDTAVWRKVTALPDVDLVYVATDWRTHERWQACCD